MSTITAVQIPNDFQYVGVAIVSTIWVLLGQGFMVGRYRKRAGIKYPHMYAEKADADVRPEANLFNCAQRAHQNTLENIPTIWATTVIVGLKMPVLAASICGLWSLSRVSYTIGYLSGDPQKRVTPLYGVGSLGALGLTLTATAQAVSWIWQGVSAKLGN